MKFGLSFLPDADPKTKNPVTYYDDIIKLCILADKAGLSTIKMTEHYLHQYGGYCPDPLTFLASVARVTSQIRLMTGCILPVFHHPIQLASRTAMVDVLSHGRLDIGFARAYLPYEFEAFEINMDESRDRFTISIETIKKLWIDEKVTIKSPYFSFTNATIFPRPVQQPHMPIWGAAVMSRQSFAWLGEQGFNLLVTPPPEAIHHLKDKIDIYRECFALNYPDKQCQIAISLPLVIDRNYQEAIKKSNQYLHYYLKVWGDAVSDWSGNYSSSYPGYARIPETLKQLTPDTMRQFKQVIVGSPNEVNEQIQFISKTLGIDHFLWQIDFGSQGFDSSLTTLQLLIEDILPVWK